MMPALLTAAAWISGHTNKVTEFIRQAMYALILFHVVHWTPEQQIGALAAISAFLAMFTEGGTVSKQRAGERIEAESERKAEIKADAKVQQIMDSGVFPQPKDAA